MNIVFWGASAFGFECCKAIVEAGWDDIRISGIFTIPEKFDIKYKNEGQHQVTNVLFRDFHWFEKEYCIPVVDINQDTKVHFDTFLSWKPDFLLCIGWYYLIPQAFIDMTPIGAAGIHASLLPKYRGNAPLVWAMINGEKETGVSLFYFDDGIDTGDIIAQKRFPIKESDTIREVLAKTEKAGIEVLLEQLPLLAKGEAGRTAQDHSQASVFPRRTPMDGRIDWDWDITRIKNFIRAQTRPYPGAFTEIGGKKIVIWDADIS